MVPFCDKLKHIKKSLKVKIFLNFFGTYKEVHQVADITTTSDEMTTIRTIKCSILISKSETHCSSCVGYRKVLKITLIRISK